MLQRIEKETGTYIWRNMFNSFVRIYGNDRASTQAWKRIDAYIQDALKNQKQTITLDIPPGKYLHSDNPSSFFHCY